MVSFRIKACPRSLELFARNSLPFMPGIISQKQINVDQFSPNEARAAAASVTCEQSG
jgi:hypothetical protein